MTEVFKIGDNRMISSRERSENTNSFFRIHSEYPKFKKLECHNKN